MPARLSIALVAVGVLAAVPSPAPARAADPIVARDTLIQYIWPLDGDLVYRRLGDRKPLPKRVWMARFRGRLHRARGIPRRASVGDIGRDAKGRKVFTFASVHRVVASWGAYFEPTKWFVYDLARNRTRPLRGLPARCVPDWVSLWRHSMAYAAECGGDSSPRVFLRQGKRTRRLPLGPGAGLVFRGGTLAVISENGGDDTQDVEQWTANGKPCFREIAASWGDATDGVWFPFDLWIANGYLTWRMAHGPLSPILAAKIAPGCDTPGPVGLVPFTPETKTLRAVAVDDRRVFYSDDKTLRRHALPATPSFDPPPNDDFENAQPLSGDPPRSATGTVAYATVQAGEPLSDTKHTVWYAYRPTTSGTVYVTVNPGCTQPGNCGNLPRFGVYTGTSPATLTEIPQSGDGYSRRYTRIDAGAGQTYWISVGSPVPEPNYEPFDIHIDSSPPSW
jgi:hypothetical protein